MPDIYAQFPTRTYLYVYTCMCTCTFEDDVLYEYFDVPVPTKTSAQDSLGNSTRYRSTARGRIS